jgi:hypothetical protein
MVPLYIFVCFFVAFLRVSQHWAFKNTTKTFWGSPCQKLVAKKAEEKQILSFFSSIVFYRVFGRFST